MMLATPRLIITFNKMYVPDAHFFIIKHDIQINILDIYIY